MVLDFVEQFGSRNLAAVSCLQGPSPRPPRTMWHGLLASVVIAVAFNRIAIAGSTILAVVGQHSGESQEALRCNVLSELVRRRNILLKHGVGHGSFPTPAGRLVRVDPDVRSYPESFM
jgi:hypothetical protein